MKKTTQNISYFDSQGATKYSQRSVYFNVTQNGIFYMAVIKYII